MSLKFEIRSYHIYRIAVMFLLAVPFFVLSTILALQWVFLMNDVTSALFGDYEDQLDGSPFYDLFFDIAGLMSYMIQMGIPFVVGYLISGIIIKEKVKLL